jgi:hypothetical protein
MARKRQADCSFTCPGGTYIDFAVWPRKGQTREEACHSKLRALKKGAVGGCELARSRYIDGIGRAPLAFTGRKTKVRIVRDT